MSEKNKQTKKKINTTLALRYFLPFGRGWAFAAHPAGLAVLLFNRKLNCNAGPSGEDVMEKILKSISVLQKIRQYYL